MLALTMVSCLLPFVFKAPIWSAKAPLICLMVFCPSGCARDVNVRAAYVGLACTRPCALCDAPHGHEDCCLRRDCADATIERFLPQDDQPATVVGCDGGIQAVYAAAVDTAVPTSVSGAPAPAVPQADLDLLARVQPDLLRCLSNLADELQPCTPEGLSFSVVYPDLALSERLELCRLYERAWGQHHGRTIRNAAKADFVALCRKCASEFPPRT
jgi:hypothetical protein